MDGVIVDSMHWHAESWQRVFHQYGLELSKAEIFKREGMSGLASIVDIIKEKGKIIPSKEELLLLQESKLEIFETGKVAMFPFAEEILEFVHTKKIKIGLVTGSLRRSVEFILPENMLSYFDVIVTVDDILNGKPHPEPYLKAMEELYSIPDETLVIENAPLGIISAKKAGADCYAIETTLDGFHLKGADMIFENHELLLKYLKENLFNTDISDANPDSSRRT